MKLFRSMVLCLITNMKPSSNNPGLTKKIENRILGIQNLLSKYFFEEWGNYEKYRKK